MQKLRAQTTPSVRYIAVWQQSCCCGYFSVCGAGDLAIDRRELQGWSRDQKRSQLASRSHPLCVSKESRHPYLSQLSLAQVIHPRDKPQRCVPRSRGIYRRKIHKSVHWESQKEPPKHACVFILCLEINVGERHPPVLMNFTLDTCFN